MSSRTVTTRTEDRDGIAVLLVSGEVDLAGSARLSAALGAALAPGAPLVVDLSGVDFLDSAGLRALALAERTAADLGGRLLIVPSPAAMRVFEITGLAAAFELCRDLDGAVGAAVDRTPAESAD
ncbi:MAG TPA: STAS domain-containing protein [Actinospica sp.]|nr:STAS domain-containing protein [Actinospica sp.]